jgi:Fe-S-cluster containining protein
LLEKKNWTGISLFPWEKQLFPEEDIKPSLGLGDDPEHPEFKIILYTYDKPGCVYLEENLCKIYNQRPLVCRSYPFRVANRNGETVFIVAPECTVIEDWPAKKITTERYVEMDDAELIGDHLSRFYKAPELKWRYKENTGWVRIGTNKTSD